MFSTPIGRNTTKPPIPLPPATALPCIKTVRPYPATNWFTTSKTKPVPALPCASIPNKAAAAFKVSAKKPNSKAKASTSSSIPNSTPVRPAMPAGISKRKALKPMNRQVSAWPNTLRWYSAASLSSTRLGRTSPSTATAKAACSFRPLPQVQTALS